MVAKTALLNAEEAIRYEMPVYGLLILLVVLVLEHQLAFFRNDKNKKALGMVFVCLMAVAFAGECIGLAQGKVCFLYPDDARNVNWAYEHREAPVAYIYNPTNQWMIWDESEELMQYEQIYFVSSEHGNVEPDAVLTDAGHVYVYKMRGEASDEMLEKIAEVNGGFSETVLVRELLYCDLYELKR